MHRNNVFINRRQFIKSVAAGGAAFSLPGCTLFDSDLPGESGDQRPNFIIILADDMGYGDSSCYQGWIETPRLERLAAEGLKFTDFHSSGVVCSPTRAGLLTGRYQQRAGVPGVINADPEHPAHRWGLDPGEITFPKLLKSRGYATAIYGKWHLGYDRKFNPVHHGFDHFRGYVSGNIDYLSHYDRMGTYDWWDNLEHVEEEGYTTHLITRHAVDFIEKNRNGPFCLYISHEAVHSPLQTPDDPPQRGPDAVKNKKDRKAKETYRQMMLEMDDGIGSVVDAVTKCGIADRTLVFFFSDNGANKTGSNAPCRGHKGSVWEGGHRVPAIAWWPGKILPGTESSQLAISLDLMPTMLDLADAALPPGHRLDGVSLRPLLLRGKELGDRKLFWNGKAMRDGRWKLVTNGKTPRLYDLAADIGETVDLAAKHPDRAKEMAAAVQAWIRDVGE